MQFGDLTFLDLPIGNFESTPPTKSVKSSVYTPRPSSGVNSRDVSMHNAYYRYLRAERLTQQSDDTLQVLINQLTQRQTADNLFKKLSMDLTLSGVVDSSAQLMSSVSNASCGQCCRDAMDALKMYCGHSYTDYSLQYHRIMVNACQAPLADAAMRLMSSIKNVCITLGL
jgi:hypothetical protein